MTVHRIRHAEDVAPPAPVEDIPAAVEEEQKPDYQFFYKAMASPEDIECLLTEGPSTFLVLHLASLSYKLNNMDATFDSIMDIYDDIPKERWEPFRKRFNKWWPERKKKIDSQTRLSKRAKNAADTRYEKKIKPPATPSEPGGIPDPSILLDPKGPLAKWIKSESIYVEPYEQMAHIWPELVVLTGKINDLKQVVQNICGEKGEKGKKQQMLDEMVRTLRMNNGGSLTYKEFLHSYEAEVSLEEYAAQCAAQPMGAYSSKIDPLDAFLAEDELN